jgi:uncharacterized membrane protein
MKPAVRRLLAALFPAAMAALSICWRLVPGSLSRPLGSFLSLTCHRLASRSLHLPWGVSGLCARCTFYWLGLAVFILLPRVVPGRTLRALLAGFIMVLPMVIDGALQYAGLYESTNAMRIATGLLGGAGTAVALRALLRVEG